MSRVRLTRQCLIRAGLCGVSLGCFLSTPVLAGELSFPQVKVVCDSAAGYCANDQGVSVSLTERYLGLSVGAHLRQVMGDKQRVHVNEFTLSTGVYCDVQEKQCYQDRYYPRTADKREVVLTRYLFGAPQ